MQTGNKVVPTETQTYSPNPPTVTTQVVIPVSAGVSVRTVAAIIYDPKALIRLNPLVRECTQLPADKAIDNISATGKQWRYHIVDNIPIFGGLMWTTTEYHATFTALPANINNDATRMVVETKASLGISTVSNWTVRETDHCGPEQSIVVTEVCVSSIPLLLRYFVVGIIKSAHIELFQRLVKQLDNSSN
ncbi:hypothetical protein V1517DRAFT_332873 [Lipomyces orientalis]|uniref:Uncharacterized protein n=1 Tax=Lipomyces orientalis TaxID=1233043 RepID=A0ACC3TDT4_9ASCO